MNEVSVKRLFKLLILNSIIFLGLGFGSILFQFAFLGWGASANSPTFNLDFASVCQLLVLAVLSLKKFNNRTNYEMIIVSMFVLLAYLLLKFVFGII
jgi:hypothetical protein